MALSLKYSGITPEVWACLQGEASRAGVAFPGGPEGAVSAQGASARYAWNEAAGTLEISFGALPAWVDPALIELRLGQAVRGCGGR